MKGLSYILMEEESLPFTTSVAHSGHYQWSLTPFDLNTTDSPFQKSIYKLFQKPLKYYRLYINDEALFSRT